MKNYSNLLRDPVTLTLGAGTCGFMATPFLGAAASGLPDWLNWILAGVFLVVGSLFIYRRINNQLFGSGVDVSEINQYTSEEDIQTCEKPNELDQNLVTEARWRIIESSLRQTPIVRGEGPILLMGLAEVDVTGDPEYKKLYFCSMFNVLNNHFYSEFKVHAPYEKILERRCEIRLLPENTIAYIRNWPSGDLPFNNILCDWNQPVGEDYQLISTCERLAFVWTDRIEEAQGKVLTKRHRIYVPIDGLREISESLGMSRAHITLEGRSI